VKKAILVLAIMAIAAAALNAQLRRPQATVTPLVERAGVHAGGPVRLALQVSLPEGLHTQSNKPLDPTLIPTVLTINAPPGVTVDEVVYPPAIELAQAGQDKPLAVFEREFAIGVQVALAPGMAEGDLVLPARLRYQACNENMCFPPATADVQWTIRVVPSTTPAGGPDIPVFETIAFGRGEKPAAPIPAASATAAVPTGDGDGLAKLDGFTVLGTAGGYLGADEFLTFIRNAETGVKARGMFEGRGPLAILVLVLIGGLALNLTPCVLPMIPINIAIIGAGAQAGSRGRGFLLGSAYGGAMALVYGAIGLVVILTAGTFGTINSSPWFNLGIAALFVVLGLAMFDVLMIDFSRFSSSFQPGASRGTVALAFTMGAVSALLAGACVAPVVIQVVLFSSNLYATGTKIALALPFCLGLGMALPWPFIGAGLASLPKPGMWMVRVKQAFGVFILATAAYYGYEAYTLFSNRWVDPAAVKASVDAQLKAGWHASLAEGLDVARREQKPVLLDIWATWCKNCLTMDRTTFENPSVQSALSGYVKIKFQAEAIDEQPAKALMQKFDAVGLPTYVILRPR
jgi:cytochrome c biogenesis protein CcdA/DsbC/DsbD-like thiol-disulfide interchange protein/thiol-disulfide isomerase/thioredoxin